LLHSSVWRTVVLCAALAGTAHAERLTTGSTEAVVFVGGADGNGIIGAGLAKALTPRWLAIGELAYIHSNAVEFGANAHYLVPLRRHPRFTPYGLLGLGVYHAGSGNGSTGFGANIGGGVRWQTGTNWGIRPEIKVFVGDGSYGRFTIGLFYKFGR
jgi:hypothetical protein